MRVKGVPEFVGQPVVRIDRRHTALLFSSTPRFPSPQWLGFTPLGSPTVAA